MPPTSRDRDKDDGYQILTARPDIEPEGESVPLDKLTRERYSDFPIDVMVADSLYGVLEDRTLMEGEPLTLHFLKRTKVAVLKASNGMEYIVPWNSTFQFSTIYDPIHQPLESLKGFTFHSAVDLMAIENLPQLVSVTSSHDGGHPSNSVQKGEILVKLETTYDPVSKTKRLKCISMRSGHQKQLNSDCVGKFSTKPSLLKQYLPEFASYLQLPTKIMFQPSQFPRYKLPPIFVNAYFTFTEQRMHLTVVASAQVSTGSYGIVRKRTAQVKRLIEISLEADVDVKLLKTPAKEMEALSETSKYICSTFEPSLVEKMIINTSPVTNQVQVELFRAVRIDCWNEGIEVVQPGVRRKPEPIPRATESDPSGAYDYPWVDFPGPQTKKAPSKLQLAAKPKSTSVSHTRLTSQTPAPDQEDDDDYMPVDGFSINDEEEYVNPRDVQDTTFGIPDRG